MYSLGDFKRVLYTIFFILKILSFYMPCLLKTLYVSIQYHHKKVLVYNQVLCISKYVG